MNIPSSFLSLLALSTLTTFPRTDFLSGRENSVGALIYYALRARYKRVIMLCEGGGRNKLKPLHPLVPVLQEYFTPFSLFEWHCPQGASLHVGLSQELRQTTSERIR